MKRIKITEPVVFDLEFEDATLRVRVDRDGLTFWKRASQGNLNAPRALDKMIKVNWENVGKAGFCYVGTRRGHEERGPANSRVGLKYLLHKNK